MTPSRSPGRPTKEDAAPPRDLRSDRPAADAGGGQATSSDDTSPDAFAKVVDRLLASPHYGERWGRYWLDTARYADTTGGDRNNDDRDYRYPYAWTYRDYVIKAFNDDKPYDQFIMEQLAADQLPDTKPDANLAALGFLTVGERFGNTNDMINDRIDVVSKGFLGLTVTCARCHDHKFDPIPTKDYYSLHGVFASIIEPAEKPLISPAGAEGAARGFREEARGAREQENRDEFYQMRRATRTMMFRAKADAYLDRRLQEPRLGSSRGGATRRRGADQGAEARPRTGQPTASASRIGDDAVFGPLEALRRWRATTLRSRRSRRDRREHRRSKYNPLVAAAFAGAAARRTSTMSPPSTGSSSRRSAERSANYVTAAAATKSEPVPGFDQPTAQLLQHAVRHSAGR